MSTKQLLVFVAVFGLVTMDYVPPLDWELCITLNRNCSAKLADIGNLLNNRGFTSLVTGGNLNIDCSASTKVETNQCYEDAANICISSLDSDLVLLKTVYDYICDHCREFIDAETCLLSGALTEARLQCDVGKEQYTSEDNCRSAPTCLEKVLRDHPEDCSTNDVDLFKEMIKQEYTIHMDQCLRWME